VYGHRTCLVTFDLTQMLFLADCDIIYTSFLSVSVTLCVCGITLINMHEGEYYALKLTAKLDSRHNFA